MRQPILYGDQLWRRNRFFVLIILAAGVYFVWYDWAVLRHPDLHSLVFLSAVLYIPVGLLLGAGWLYNRWRNRIDLTDAGLTVSKLTSSVTIGYDSIRQVRVQPLATAYPGAEGKRQPPHVKALLQNQALFVRLWGREEEATDLYRRLGARYVIDGSIVLPVSDPPTAASFISGRLPKRANSGASRRRRK